MVVVLGSLDDDDDVMEYLVCLRCGDVGHWNSISGDGSNSLSVRSRPESINRSIVYNTVNQRRCPRLVAPLPASGGPLMPSAKQHAYEVNGKPEEAEHPRPVRRRESLIGAACSAFGSSLRDSMTTPTEIYGKDASIRKSRSDFDSVGLDEPAVAQMHRLFRRIDVDGSGTVDIGGWPGGWVCCVA